MGPRYRQREASSVQHGGHSPKLTHFFQGRGVSRLLWAFPPTVCIRLRGHNAAKQSGADERIHH